MQQRNQLIIQENMMNQHPYSKSFIFNQNQMEDLRRSASPESSMQTQIKISNHNESEVQNEANTQNYIDSFSLHKQKKQGHFRGESFGDSLPLDYNQASLKNIIQNAHIEEHEVTVEQEDSRNSSFQHSRSLSKTDSLRILPTYQE